MSQYPLLESLLNEINTIDRMAKERAAANRERMKAVRAEEKAARDAFNKKLRGEEQKRTPMAKVDLWKVARIIEDAVGNAIPDGDPIDSIYPQLNKLGVDSSTINKTLNAACKAHLGAKSYDAYLADMYDSYIEANIDNNDNPPGRNPWR